MTSKHPAAGARALVGTVTAVAFVGMIAGYQVTAAAGESGVATPTPAGSGTPMQPQVESSK